MNYLTPMPIRFLWVHLAKKIIAVGGTSNSTSKSIVLLDFDSRFSIQNVVMPDALHNYCF